MPYKLWLMLLLKSKILIVGVLIMAASTFCLSFLMYPTSTQNARKDDRPNIVLIMADDMGYSDLGLFGSEINTPHLDKLAKNGLILTQFYNTSRCCPSRAALLTGIYQHEAGVGDMNNDRGFPNYQGYLNKQCVTIAEVLKDAGYTTMMSGILGTKKNTGPANEDLNTSSESRREGAFISIRFGINGR
jgi:arylsulfatase